MSKIDVAVGLQSGKPRRAVEGLLFAQRYVLDVVIPSMQPIAAWLALWDERVRARILPIAPDILIEHGDPSRLTVDIRAQLLRRFASMNEGRSDTGASFDMTSVRQSAFANLARQRYETSQDEGRRLTWLVAWLCIDAGAALDPLCAWVDDAEDHVEATRRMIAFCNGPDGTS